MNSSGMSLSLMKCTLVFWQCSWSGMVIRARMDYDNFSNGSINWVAAAAGFASNWREPDYFQIKMCIEYWVCVRQYAYYASNVEKKITSQSNIIILLVVVVWSVCTWTRCWLRQIPNAYKWSGRCMHCMYMKERAAENTKQRHGKRYEKNEFQIQNVQKMTHPVSISFFCRCRRQRQRRIPADLSDVHSIHKSFNE